MEGVLLPVNYPKVKPCPRLVPGCGGWHVIGATGQVCGKVARVKGTDRRIVILKGTVLARELGVHRSQITRWLVGTQQPQIGIQRRINRLFGIINEWVEKK